jgi:transcriptional regulator with XRE-family HTH domain
MPDDTPMTARFRLRELLEACGMSQSQLARDAGVSFATVNRLCTNATEQVSLATLDKIAGVLGVAPGALIEHVKKGPR